MPANGKQEPVRLSIAQAIADAKKSRESLIKAVEGLETYVQAIKKQVVDNVKAMELSVEDAAAALNATLLKVEKFDDQMGETWQEIWEPKEEDTSITPVTDA